MTQKRKRRTHSDVVRAIEDAADLGYRAGEIEERLKEMKLPRGAKIPNRRTIHRIVSDHQPPDQSDEWRFADAQPEDAALVLPVLAYVAASTEARKASFTQAEAGWVIRIRKVVPDAPLVTVWRLARRYMGRQAVGRRATDLDLLLGFAPWRPEISEWPGDERLAHWQDWMDVVPGVTEANRESTIGVGEEAQTEAKMKEKTGGKRTRAKARK